MESILDSIKKLLGPSVVQTHFDTDIIMHINTVLMILDQVVEGLEQGFSISDSTALWSDYLPNNRIEGVKTYVYLKVKLIFDPPTSSALIDVINQTLKELEWRLSIAEVNNNQNGGN